MTTGKIDRAASQLAALNQLNKTLTNGVGQAGTVAPAAAVEQKPAGPENLFGDRSKLLDVKTGEGKAVSTTAAAEALWGRKGAGSSRPPLNVQTIRNMSVDQAKAKMAELDGQKKNLEGRIAGRAGELDSKWKYMALAKKTTALKEYLAQTPNLPPEIRAELEQAIKLSDTAQVKLEELKVQVRELRPHAQTGKNGSPEERKALAHQLWTARRAQTEAVTAATTAVDAAGLKIERLALTENIIDPTGGAESKNGSMLAMVQQYFEVSFMYDTIGNMFFGPLFAFLQKLDKESAERKKKDAIEEAWAQRADLNRRIIREIPVKVEELRSNLKPGEGPKVRTAVKVETLKLNGNKG